MDSETIYQTLLKKCPQQDRNIHYLKRYVNFIFACIENNEDLPEDIYTEKHHILPGSLWPQYVNFKEHSWNCSILTARQHFIAHWMLAKSLGKNMWYSFKMMCTIKLKQRDYKVTSIVYEMAKINQAIELSKREISEETRQKMSASSKGKFVVKDTKTGKYLKCSFDDLDFASGRYVGIAKGKVSVLNTETGERIQCSIEDPNYISGKYVGINTNMVVVKDTTTGEILRCTKDDKNYISGRYVGIASGKVSVVDSITGESFQCSKNDPHYISGRYVPLSKGRNHSEDTKNKISETLKNKPKIVCKYCGYKSSAGVISRLHNDKCKNKPDDIITLF